MSSLDPNWSFCAGSATMQQFGGTNNSSSLPLSLPLSSPLSQLSTNSMDSGYTESSTTSPTLMNANQVMTHQQSYHSSSSVMQAFDVIDQGVSFTDFDTNYYGTINNDTIVTYSPEIPVATVVPTGFKSPMIPVNVPISQPFLEITEQPTNKPFRFRYKSEMHGTHGSLMGIRTERSRRTYPTVALRNFNFEAKAIIRCSLYQFPSDNPNAVRGPHSHKLVIRRGDNEEADPHDVEVSTQNDFTAVFQGMGIIHTAKPKIKEELCKKIRAEKVFEENRELTSLEIAQIEQVAEQQAKEMKLNQVCLRFQAFIKNGALNRWVKLCEPIYSNVVNNMKSPLTGELRIMRMSTFTSPAEGGQEVFMFVEKVCKNNIKVKFYDNEWEDFGVFNESDVHHQYGIVLKTPPFDRKRQINSPIIVHVQLIRPSDGAASEPQEFRYKPNVSVGKKRPRANSTDIIPTVVGSHETQDPSMRPYGGSVRQSQNSPQAYGSTNYSCNKNYEAQDSVFDNEALPNYFASFTAQDINLSSNDLKGLWCTPEEFCRLLDIEIGGDSKLEIDAAGGKQTQHQTSSDINCSLFDKLKMLIKLFRNNFEDEKLQEMMMVLVKAQDETGENLLIDCIQAGSIEEIKSLVMILIKYKLTDVLKSVNELDQNCFHLLILEGYTKLLKIFLNLGVDINQADAFGLTPLHFAVQQGVECVKELVDGSTGIKLDELNDDGYSPLHIAVKDDKFEIVQLLIEAGADIKKKSPPTGDNVLHIAAAATKANVEMIKFLVARDESLLYEENHCRLNVLQVASNQEQPSSLIQYLSRFYAESYTRNKAQYDSEETASDSDNDTVDNVFDSMFDEQCLKEMSAIFDENGKWQGLALLMEFEEKVDEWEQTDSPTRCLFKHLEKTKKTIDYIVEIIDMVDEKRAISVIDEMLVRKYDV